MQMRFPGQRVKAPSSRTRTHEPVNKAVMECLTEPGQLETVSQTPLTRRQLRIGIPSQ
jgi:hypothetical protein